MDKEIFSDAFFAAYGGSAVPRYTSYPSAAHFQAGFPSAVHERALGELPPGTPVSVYVHVPFCRALCQYCGCFTRVVHDDGPVADYLSLLKTEIALAGKLTERRVRAAQIHLGGGSPNLLDGGQLKDLLNTIRENFETLESAEISMECDPRQMTEEKARAYAAAGVNRISLGVQDFNEETQKAINRIQPVSQIAACVAWFRRAGVRSINFDLMYGLPRQTESTVAQNAARTAELGADRVALFGYAHVPWMKTHQKMLEKHSLPSPRERYEQEQAARAVFVEKGYQPVGMDHFAKPGDALAVAARQCALHRNFQGYTTDNVPTLMAFGLSAISRTPGSYAQNTSSPGFYEDSLKNGRLPVEKGLLLTEEDRLRADVIERLMCSFSVDVGEICKRHGFAPYFLDDSVKKVTALEKDGLAETDGRVVAVTKRGRPFVRSVGVCFDAYFGEPGKRYARAV